MSDTAKKQTMELENLEVIEANELKVGNAFHAFRFALPSEQPELKELENLEVIEANELKVGNAFHAFRFTLPG